MPEHRTHPERGRPGDWPRHAILVPKKKRKAPWLELPPFFWPIHMWSEEKNRPDVAKFRTAAGKPASGFCLHG